MISSIAIQPVNAVFSEILTDDLGVLQDLRDHLTFTVPHARFQPAFKKGHWDGQIKLVNRHHQVYSGLAGRVEEYCQENGVTFANGSVKGAVINAETVQWLVNQVGLPPGLVPRDYQLAAILEAFKSHRALFVSPTASGKSLIIYLLIRALTGPSLIIVPTSALVYQMVGDFKEYGMDTEAMCHTVSGGPRDTDKQITISTWQSLVEQPREWFDRFQVVIGDEAHLFQAASLKKIMENLTNAYWRFGFTGTLSGSKTHAMVLEGLFGSVKTLTTTRALQDQGHIAQTDIKVIILKHPEKARQKWSYPDEIEYLIGCEARNNFIVKLTMDLKGNTLVLFNRIEQHGHILHQLFSERLQGRELYYFHGGISGEVRNTMRQELEQVDGAIALASYGVFSTGMNVKRLHNLVLASPWKSRVLNLQSLGRGLRLSDDKDKLTVYDLGDDLTWGKHQNHTLKHLNERIRIYCSEMLENYRCFPIELAY